MCILCYGLWVFGAVSERIYGVATGEATQTYRERVQQLQQRKILFPNDVAAMAGTPPRLYLTTPYTHQFGRYHDSLDAGSGRAINLKQSSKVPLHLVFFLWSKTLTVLKFTGFEL